MKRNLIIVLCLLQTAFLVFAQENNTFNIKKYGAIGSKDQLVTAIIQRAIDDCNRNGGGTVFIPAGNYLTAPIFLRSNVNLNLDRGATLFASRNPNDYLIGSNLFADDRRVALIRAENLQHVSITGEGTIHGQAEQIWSAMSEVDNFIANETEIARQAGIPMMRAYQVEPKLVIPIYFFNCKDVRIQNVTVIDGPFWNVHIERSSDILVSGIHIRSSLTHGVNSDGIDIDGCKNVTVSDCNIQTGDDAICLKTTLLLGKYESCENIVVNNCVLTSTSTALKLGTESHGDFKNIIFSNCAIYDANRGLSIVIRDGANVSNVQFNNIVLNCKRKHFNWWGNADPIFITLLKRTPTSRLGSIKNVSFSNIWATGQGTSIIQGFQDNLKEGLPTKALENIKLHNVNFEMQAEDTKDKRATSGFEARFVDDLSLENVLVHWDSTSIEEKWDKAFVFKNINGFFVENCKGRQAQHQGVSFHFDNCSDGIVRECQGAKNTDTMFSFTGSKTANLLLLNNIGSMATKLIEIKDDASKKQIKLVSNIK